MGKSKSRIFRKGINNQFPKLTREDAIMNAIKCLNDADITAAKRLITIFSISAEELLEAGAAYENVVAIKNIFG